MVTIAATSNTTERSRFKLLTVIIACAFSGTVLDAWFKAAIESNGQKRELKPAHFNQGCIFAWVLSV
jgi:hypothetical protein